MSCLYGNVRIVQCTGPATMGNLREGESSRQMLTEQREELRDAVLAEALRRHRAPPLLARQLGPRWLVNLEMK